MSPFRDSNIVTIDVGGQVFQTSKQTLAMAGPQSILSKISNEAVFIDRDPDLFSLLLSLLRTGNLPAKSQAFDLQDIFSEAEFYGMETLLVASQSNPSQFEAFNLEKCSTTLQLNGRETPSALSTTSFGSVHVAHGSKITSFDWSLRRKKTILTQFTAVDSLLALSPSVAAAGATDFSGLQILDLKRGSLKQTLSWENATRSSSTVQGIGSSKEFLFSSFESGRRNSSTIMVYDISALLPVTEIGKNEIYGADLDSAIPATKLNWISNYNLLMASGSHSGPSGVLGSIKLWDVRSGNANPVWDYKEKTDCFADITVSDDLSSMFKVGVNSGDVFYSDLRALGGSENPWICLGDGRKGVTGRNRGVGCKIEGHGDQVFCSKGSGVLEVWSEVLVNSLSSEDGLEGRVFRRNLLGTAKDNAACSRVSHIRFGGNKMFVTRKDEQSIEVWQCSSRRF